MIRFDGGWLDLGKNGFQSTVVKYFTLKICVPSIHVGTLLWPCQSGTIYTRPAIGVWKALFYARIQPCELCYCST